MTALSFFLALTTLHSATAFAFVPQTTGIAEPTFTYEDELAAITNFAALAPTDIARVQHQNGLRKRQFGGIAELYTVCSLDCGDGSYCQVFDAARPSYGVCCPTGQTCTARTACVAEASHTYGVTDIGSWGGIDSYSTFYCGINDRYCNTLVFESALNSRGDDLTVVNCYTENFGYSFISADATGTANANPLFTAGTTTNSNKAGTTALAIGAIVGIAIGGLFLLGLIGGGIALCCICSRRKKRRAALAAQQQQPMNQHQNQNQGWNGNGVQPGIYQDPNQGQFQPQNPPVGAYNQNQQTNGTYYQPTNANELDTPIEAYKPPQSQMPHNSQYYNKPALDARLSSYNTGNSGASAPSEVSELPSGNPYFSQANAAGPPNYDARARHEMGGGEIPRQPLPGNGFENHAASR